jgi:hypothetical protein
MPDPTARARLLALLHAQAARVNATARDALVRLATDPIQTFAVPRDDEAVSDAMQARFAQLGRNVPAGTPWALLGQTQPPDAWRRSAVRLGVLATSRVDPRVAGAVAGAAPALRAAAPTLARLLRYGVGRALAP